jgi:hypothetical protein
MHRCFGVSELPEQLLAVGTRRHCRRLFADANGPLGNPVLKVRLLLETTPLLLHGALLSDQRKAGALPGVLITDKGHELRGDSNQRITPRDGCGNKS